MLVQSAPNNSRHFSSRASRLPPAISSVLEIEKLQEQFACLREGGNAPDRRDRRFMRTEDRPSTFLDRCFHRDCEEVEFDRGAFACAQSAFEALTEQGILKLPEPNQRVRAVAKCALINAIEAAGELAHAIQQSRDPLNLGWPVRLWEVTGRIAQSINLCISELSERNLGIPQDLRTPLTELAKKMSDSTARINDFPRSIAGEIRNLIAAPDLQRVVERQL